MAAKTITSLDEIRALLQAREYGVLRVAFVSRGQIRRAVLPAVRAHIGSEAPERVVGLRTNWAGRPFMAR